MHYLYFCMMYAHLNTSGVLLCVVCSSYILESFFVIYAHHKPCCTSVCGMLIIYHGVLLCVVCSSYILEYFCGLNAHHKSELAYHPAEIQAFSRTTPEEDEGAQGRYLLNLQLHYLHMQGRQREREEKEERWEVRSTIKRIATKPLFWGKSTFS